MMIAPAITVSPDESVLGALALMTRRRIRHLPVVEGDTLYRPGLDRRPGEVSDRTHRIGSGCDARLYPGGVILCGALPILSVAVADQV